MKFLNDTLKNICERNKTELMRVAYFKDLERERLSAVIWLWGVLRGAKCIWLCRLFQRIGLPILEEVRGTCQLYGRFEILDW